MFHESYLKSGAPYLVHVLNIDDPKDEDELVEYKVPKFVFQLGLLGDTKLAKHALLDGLSQQNQQAVGHVDQCLK